MGEERECLTHGADFAGKFGNSLAPHRFLAGFLQSIARARSIRPRRGVKPHQFQLNLIGQGAERAAQQFFGFFALGVAAVEQHLRRSEVELGVHLAQARIFGQVPVSALGAPMQPLAQSALIVHGDRGDVHIILLTLDDDGLEALFPVEMALHRLPQIEPVEVVFFRVDLGGQVSVGGGKQTEVVAAQLSEKSHELSFLREVVNAKCRGGCRQP